MSSYQAQTHFHRLIPAVKAGNVITTTIHKDPKTGRGKYAELPRSVHNWPTVRHNIVGYINAAKSLPMFLFKANTLNQFPQEQIVKQVQALANADLLQMPYPEQVVEVDDESGGSTICVVMETDAKGQYDVTVMQTYGRGREEAIDFHPYAINVAVNNDAERIQFKAKDFIILERDGNKHLLDRVDEPTHMRAAQLAGRAVVGMLLFCSARGISREKVVPPPKLNKARLKAAKEVIPEYTYISIGTYQDREGREHRYDERRAPILHWRKAHTRRQRIGPRTGDAFKIVSIAPVLVNYDPERPDLKPATPIYHMKGSSDDTQG